MAAVDTSKYAHSPVHKATLSKDYASLTAIISSLPRFRDPSDIRTESVSAAEEAKADAIAAAIDRRDVPNRDTPLHLAVGLSDAISTEMLMLAGADWSLQNAQGWSALQEAICTKDEDIVKIIVRHCQPLAWAKWCRRLPRLIGTMRRMRDFYMEIGFRFESSVVPFVSKIAPSDTYKIWKQGANLRADTTLAGFDGFKIQRSDQSFLFLGDGSGDGKVLPGSFFVVSHKDKEVLNAMDGAGTPVAEDEVEQEVNEMCRTNVFRPGIDVTQAVLLPQTTWRRQEKTEMVGPWRAKVYDMHNVVVSIKSRKVPGAAATDDDDDDQYFNSYNDNEMESHEAVDVLTEEERSQLDSALKMHSSEVIDENGDEGIIAHRHSCYNEQRDHDHIVPIWNKQGEKKSAPPRSSLCVEDNINVGNVLEGSPSRSRNRTGRHSIEHRRGNVLTKLGPPENVQTGNFRKDKNHHEYKKGLRPTLCLSPNFPLQTEELLPLLDILANKVKAIRRLRELLTTKLPKGTFPVKVAIPVVPTIRVIVTFTKFEEVQPLNDDDDEVATRSTSSSSSSSSWFQWIKSPYNYNERPYSSTTGGHGTSTNKIENVQDPFAIPCDYKWITSEDKKKKMQHKMSQSMKAKARK